MNGYGAGLRNAGERLVALVGYLIRPLRHRG